EYQQYRQHTHCKKWQDKSQQTSFVQVAHGRSMNSQLVQLPHPALVVPDILKLQVLVTGIDHPERTFVIALQTPSVGNPGKQYVKRLKVTGGDIDFVIIQCRGRDVLRRHVQRLQQVPNEYTL